MATNPNATINSLDGTSVFPLVPQEQLSAEEAAHKWCSDALRAASELTADHQTEIRDLATKLVKGLEDGTLTEAQKDARIEAFSQEVVIEKLAATSLREHVEDMGETLRDNGLEPGTCTLN